ncbi:MAG: hypothetical protein ABIR22_11440 [Candidatus Eisenbacteria bacterium]
MLRRLLGVLAGLVAGAIVVALIEGLGHALWPPPAGADLRDPEQLKALIPSLPIGALIAVVLGWAMGSFSGGWMAATISRDFRMALVVGFILLCMGVVTMVQIPHPLWMWVMGVALPLPAAWFGARLAPKTAS